MKNCTSKIVSFLMAVTLIVPFISGCSDNSDNSKDSDNTFFHMRCDSEVSYNEKGEFSVNISVDNTTFVNNIESNNIKVFYSDINFSSLPDIDATEAVMLKEGEYNTVYADVTSVTMVSDNSAAITFCDKYFSTNRPDCFFVYCNENTNTAGKRFLSMITVKYPSYSLVSDTTQVNSGNSTDRFKLTLDKSSFVSDISADDIILSGGFENCTVSELDRTGDNMLSLVIASDDGYGTGNYGFITVKHNAVIDSPVDISVAVSIISPKVVFSSSDFEASANYAKATLILTDCMFNDSVTADSFKCDNSEVGITRFDRVSASEGVLYMSFDDKTSVDVIDIISKSSFSVQESALNINYSLSFGIEPLSPDVSGSITEIKEVGSDFSVTAEFTVSDGSFNVISKNSFIFGGDYAKAVITSITAQDNSATLCFDIPKTSSAETAELYGTVGLRTGAVLSRWGTQPAIAPFPIYYSSSQTKQDVETKYNDDLIPMIMALSEYFADYDDLDIKSLMSIEVGEKTFKEIYSSISDSFAEIYSYIYAIEQIVSLDKISVSLHNEESILAVNRYLHDLKAMYGTVNTLNSSLARLIAIEEQISSVKDEQELDSLNAEKNELSARITAAYSSNIKGKTFSELLNDVIVSYCDDIGALVCFDSVCDSNYNWYLQSVDDRNTFRMMSYSVIINSAVIEYYCELLNNSENSGAVLQQLSGSLKQISEFAQENVVDSTNRLSVYSTTLGRSFKLVKINNALNNTVNEISLSDIAQLENKFTEGNTLDKELASIGIDLSSVRYIVCADSNITDRSENVSENVYSFVERATLYDLNTAKTVNEFEFNNYYYRVQINEEGVPVAVPFVNKYYQLYTFK